MAIKHLYLPKLNSGASISEPANDGVWDNKDHQIIQAISDGIEVDEAAQTRGVSSVPDIYARPLTFLGGFRSEKHPLRNRITQEWRGLLSLLALHKLKPDLNDLEIVTVNLADEKIKGEKFPKALNNLADRPVTLERSGTQYLWTDFVLIKFKGTPLGAFSPATLVFTSADYNRKLLKESFPLMDEIGYLKPPSKGNGLDAVGKWLDHFIKQFNLIAQTSTTVGGDHKYVGDINKMLEQWLFDIKEELGIPQNTDVKADTVKIDDGIIDSLRENPPQVIRKYAIYQLLLTPVAEDESKTKTAFRSDYSLQMFRNKLEGGIKEVVVITPSLLGRNQNLWRGTSPSELDKDPSVLIDRFFVSASGNNINNINLEKDDTIWIRPDLYFLTDTLLKGYTDNILNDEEKYLNDGNTEFILPFRKEILYFFSPEEIKQQLNPHYDIGNTKVVFSFTLPLVGGQKVEVKKTYRNRGEMKTNGEGTITEAPQVPVIEIFPNYSGDFWCQYFLMNNAIDQFSVEPLNYDAEHKLSNKVIQTNESSEVKINLQRISGYNSFPEAVELTYLNNTTGLILLRRNPDFNNDKFDNEDEVVIGVDFGTSNTNIYYLKNSIPAKASLAFADYTRRLTNANKNERKEIEKQFFVPINNIELPIPTTLKRYYVGKYDQILFDHFIYFPTDYKYDKNVSSNIKWDSDDSKMLSFIESLVFLMLLDIVHKKMGNIKIKCTYPKSFSDQKKSAYNRTWETILQTSIKFGNDRNVAEFHKTAIFTYADPSEIRTYIHGSHYTAVSHTLGKLMIDTSPEFVSEGEATGHYFSSPKIYVSATDRANKKFGAICIDVGGGTTDYSVWFDNEIIYDCSVNLAGGQISKVIAANSRLYSLLFSDEAVKALRAVIENPMQFSSVLNYVLKREGSDISARIIKNVNSKEIAWLRRTIAIEFGALSFFAGHIALAINKYTGNSRFKNAIRENGIRLHWGGNAAKLISWIDYGKFDADGIAAKFLNGLFRNAILNPALGEFILEKPSFVGQIQSIGHKDEASGGSILMGAVSANSKAQKMDEDDDLIYNTSADTKMEGLIISEPMVIDGKQYKHYDIQKKGNFFDQQHHSLVDSVRLEQFEEFIKVLNAIGMRNGLFPEDNQIKLSEAYKTSVRAEIIANFDDLAAADESKRVVQPPFITSVSQFLEEYTTIQR